MQSGDRPALVTGASGFVGSHIARLLVRQGRPVRILLRKTSNMEATRDLPVGIHHGDVLEPPSLRAAMEGCRTVFYCVVDPRFWLTDVTPIYRNNVEGLVHAMDAALACNIERFVFTSTMGRCRCPHGRYPRRRAGRHTRRTTRQDRRTLHHSQRVHQQSGFFQASDDRVWQQTAQNDTAASGIPVAWVAERVLRLLRRKDYLISTDAVYLSTVFREMDNSKARRELGWNPRPIAETVRDAVRRYAEREAEL